MQQKPGSDNYSHSAITFFLELRITQRLLLLLLSLQSCPTLCDPIDGSPPGSPVPGILQARTLEWVAISFSNEWKWKVKVKPLSHVWLLATSWIAAYQAPPSMEFSRQEYWSGVPLLIPDISIKWALNFVFVLKLCIDFLSLATKSVLGNITGNMEGNTAHSIFEWGFGKMTKSLWERQ